MDTDAILDDNASFATATVIPTVTKVGSKIGVSRAVVDAPFLKDEDRLETLFLAALTRKPTEKEQKVMLKYLASQKDKKPAFGDIFWSLLNTPEFVLSR